MLKKLLLSMSILLVVVSPLSVQARDDASDPNPAPVTQEVYAVLDAVNALRIETGKTPYEVSPILMTTAQNQADYMASIQTVTHLGPNGISTTDRLLAAGYPLAGNISLGGIRSENITAGPNMTVDEAIADWKGDDIHYNTMTSPNYTQIGAGIARSGEDVYYVIDCARHIGALSPYLTNTPEPTIEGDNSQTTETANNSGYVTLPGEGPLATSLLTATPGADGKQYHTVKDGETLWLIAISYGLKIINIRDLNYMAEGEAVYPGEKLLIRQGLVVTPVPPSASNTPAATLTAQSTRTRLPSPTATITATPAQSAPALSNTSIGVGLLVLAVILIIGWMVVLPVLQQAADERRSAE